VGKGRFIAGFQDEQESPLDFHGVLAKILE
jgi:hypothetical protein